MFQPKLVALVAFDPVTAALRPGSWGATIAIVTAAQKFQVTLSPEYAGVFLAAEASRFCITPTIHEIYTGYTYTPKDQGFEIDFGIAMVRDVTLKVEALVSF